MAKVARTALTVVGGYLFGPWGALIGSFVGSLLFPEPGVKGPRINELNVQHSTVGAPIPLVYGTVALAGNVIWSGGLDETEHEGSGGGKKGGGGAASNFTYSVNVAIGIGEGGHAPINHIRRIWADADLIYDASDDGTLLERLQQNLHDSDDPIAQAFIDAIRALSAQLDFTFYPGDEDQLPDPLIESYEGVGEVPAFRGLAYVVFQNFQLEKYGNRIPNFRFEVTTEGTPTECGLYSPGHLEPWQYMIDGGTYDPRNPLNDHVYWYNEIGGTSFGSYEQAMADINGATDHPDQPFILGKFPGQGETYVHGYGLSSTPNHRQPFESSGIDLPDLSVDYTVLWLTINVPEITLRRDSSEIGGGGGSDCGTMYSFLGGKGHPVYINAGGFAGVYVGTDHDQDPAPYFGGVPFTSSDSSRVLVCSDPVVWDEWRLTSHEMAVRRTQKPPDPCAFGEPIPGAPGWCVIAGQIVQGITWTLVSGTFHVLQKYASTNEFGGQVTAYPVGPALKSTDTNYNNQAFWESAYADALAAGEPIAPGLVYGVDYPETQSSAYFSECATLDVACVPMATIVSDLCRRAGLRTDTSTQIDVSDLTTCVPGYVLGMQMSARDAMGPLRLFGLWDCVESGAVLKFVERGHAIAATVTTDDLGVAEAGQSPPSAMQVARLQEKDLPRRVRLHFPNFKHDHEASEQDASRLTTEAVTELDINVPVSMDPDTAKQLAEISLAAEWVGRNSFSFSLNNDWLHIEPTDCIEIPVDGETRRVRILTVNYSIGGILQIEAVEDDDGSYVSTAVSIPAGPSGGVPLPGTGPICNSVAVLLDIPRLREIDIDAGYYAAIYGLCDSWNCAELYRSNDGGLTYGRVARTDIEATVGAISDLATGGDFTVTLFNGELSSVTHTQIDAGQNMAAVGIDGRWVIIQFQTATLTTSDTYALTDITWGINDTAHLLGTTVDGDTFVLLSDPALIRIPESPEAIGVEKDFKILTCGQALDDIDAFPFTTWGLSYQRLCPATVLSATTITPPVSPSDGDSYLLPNDTSLDGVWSDHGGEIATWSDETDSWVYCTPAPGTVIHILPADSSDDPTDVISGGDGTTTPAPWQRAIEWQDEGIAVAAPGEIKTVNFTGSGVVATLDSSGVLNVDISSGSGTSLQFQDEGVDLGSPDADTFNLVGPGVVATRVGNTITATISGGSVSDGTYGQITVTGGGTTWTINDAELAAIAGLTSAADKLPYFTGSGTAALADFSSFARTLVDDANQGAMQTTLGLVIGTNVQAWDADLDTIAGLTATTDNFIQSKAGAWASRTVAQVKTDLGLTGTNSGDQTITLTGAVTGSGTGSFATTYGDAEIAALAGLTSAADKLPYFTGSGTAALADFSSFARTYLDDTSASAVRTTIGAGDASGPGSSTDNALARFDGTTGKLIQNSATILSDTDTITTPNAAADEIGYKGVPMHVISANTTIAASDHGKCFLKNSGGAITLTIDSNSNLALPIGFACEGINDDTENLAIAITADTLVMYRTGATGARTVAPRGYWNLRKVDTTRWYIGGDGVT